MLASDADGLRYICHRLPLGPVAKGRSQAPAREQRLVVARRLDAASTGIDLASSLFGLTRRERDVLLGLVQIGNMPSIAAAFGISASTVHTHLTSLFAKTGSRSYSPKYVTPAFCGWRAPSRASGFAQLFRTGRGAQAPKRYAPLRGSQQRAR